MYITMLTLPWASAFRARGFGFRIGHTYVSYRAVGMVATAALFALFAFSEIGLRDTVVDLEMVLWVNTREHDLCRRRFYDPISASITLVVRLLSTRVHSYAVGYMAHDAHRGRFIGYLARFTATMLVLVTSGTRVQLYRGWERVGVASYRLISFWFTRRQAGKAGRKAMVVNRVGDWFLSRGIRFGYAGLGCTAYTALWPLSGSPLDLTLLRRGFGLLGGTLGKSAQLGLHMWLPDAMEGPTPVSALLHSATMVTAGVYRLTRLSPRLETSVTVLHATRILGGLTARYAGSVGLVQHDLKRVIAYSTCSQLGYMVVGAGRSAYDASMAHRANHALYKALLFRCSGAIIHGIADEQDMRRMGGLARRLPMTYAWMLVASLSLMGLPFLTGFYSKDALREVAWSTYSSSSHTVYLLLLLAGACTTFYSRRRLSSTFFGTPIGTRTQYLHVSEATTPMVLPITFLGFGAVLAGWLLKDRTIGRGTTYWGPAMGSYTSESSVWIESEHLDLTLKRLPAIVVLLVASYTLHLYATSRSRLYQTKLASLLLYRFRAKKWYADKLAVELVASPVLYSGALVFEELDRGLLELLFGNGLHLHLTDLGHQQGRRILYLESIPLGLVALYRLS